MTEPITAWRLVDFDLNPDPEIIALQRRLSERIAEQCLRDQKPASEKRIR